jgi:TRAP-type mannitol/chloroaromatic compound transport system substrate-binding protein
MFNKEAWDSLSERDQELIEDAAKLVTFETWTKIGQEDAKALEFFKSQGNEIIELDESVQIETKNMAREWAAEQASENEWFDKIWKSQQEFEALWKDATRYRNTKG